MIRLARSAAPSYRGKDPGNKDCFSRDSGQVWFGFPCFFQIRTAMRFVALALVFLGVAASLATEISFENDESGHVSFDKEKTTFELGDGNLEFSTSDYLRGIAGLELKHLKLRARDFPLPDFSKPGGAYEINVLVEMDGFESFKLECINMEGWPEGDPDVVTYHSLAGLGWTQDVVYKAIHEEGAGNYVHLLNRDGGKTAQYIEKGKELFIEICNELTGGGTTDVQFRDGKIVCVGGETVQFLLRHDVNEALEKLGYGFRYNDNKAYAICAILLQKANEYRDKLTEVVKAFVERLNSEKGIKSHGTENGGVVKTPGWFSKIKNVLRHE